MALIIDAKRTDPETGSFTEYLTDYLIAHGVTVRQPVRPLSLEEVLKHLDEPVWLKDLKEPALSHWGIVEGGSASDGTQYLYLHGEPGHYRYGESVVAYLHKPKEGKYGQRTDRKGNRAP